MRLQCAQGKRHRSACQSFVLFFQLTTLLEKEDTGQASNNEPWIGYWVDIEPWVGYWVNIEPWIGYCVDVEPWWVGLGLALRVQAIAYRLQATGYRPQRTAYRLPATAYRLSGTAYRLQATRQRERGLVHRTNLDPTHNPSASPNAPEAKEEARCTVSCASAREATLGLDGLRFGLCWREAVSSAITTLARRPYLASYAMHP